MRFGGEIDDRARAVQREQRRDQCAIADIAADEYVARVRGERREIAEVARVSRACPD